MSSDFFYICVCFLWVFWFHPTAQKHSRRLFGYAKLPLCVNEWLNVMFVHGALPWLVYHSEWFSHLTPSIPRIGSRSTATLNWIKWLLKVIECEVYRFDVNRSANFHIKEYIFISSCCFLVFQASLTKCNQMKHVFTQYGCFINVFIKFV